jgi:superfamily II DNA helicase RecQ
MWYLEEDVHDLEERGFCSVCLTPLNAGDHSACDIFSGTSGDEDRYRFSPRRLEEYRGSWTQIAATAFYSQLIPWGIATKELPSWFSLLEGILIDIERGRLNSSKIIKALTALEGDYFSIRRLAKDDRYPYENFFGYWDPSRPLTPVDYYIRELQINDRPLDFQPLRSWREILQDISKTFEHHEPLGDIDYPVNWTKLQKSDRVIRFCGEQCVVTSLRAQNGRPFISSIREIGGCWLGWKITNEREISVPSLTASGPPELKEEGHYLIGWGKLLDSKCSRRESGLTYSFSRTEAELRHIVRAHGMELLGNSDPNKSDDRARDSHAEFVMPNGKGIIERLQPFVNYGGTRTIFFDEPSDTIPCLELESIAGDFIRRFTRFDKPTCSVQARAIGWILEHPNTLVQTVMPTGKGKSLIPLCAAMDLFTKAQGKNSPPLVIVVCPLISLLEDQVNTARRDSNISEFKNKDKKVVACLHSCKGQGQWGEVLESIRDGECSLLFLTADQLQTEKVLQAINTRAVGWVFIDEAHGIIEFENYRPAYSRIWYPIQRLKNNSPAMGLEIQTATLPKSWEDEVWRRLLRQDRLLKPAIFRSSAIRKNLRFDNVIRLQPGEGELRNQLSVKKAVEFARLGQRTIIYSLYNETHSPNDPYSYFEHMYQDLLEELPNAQVGCYSGDGSMINGEVVDRNEFVDRFTRGEILVTLATMAFGLGIDNKDVKAIIFNGMPSSINTLYQQAGRAARGLKDDLSFKYEGQIHIIAEEQQDFNHQRSLTSKQRLLATTATKHLENMLAHDKSNIFEGFQLLYLRAQEGCEGQANGDTFYTKNALRILSNIGAIEWFATLPDKIIIPKSKIGSIGDINGEEFLENAIYEALNGDLLSVDLRELLKFAIDIKNVEISDIYDTIEDISLAGSQKGAGWGRGASYSLVGWLWTGTKVELEEAIVKWRLKDADNYDNEEDISREFLSINNHEDRMSVIARYFDFCNIKCTGCEGCK